jgi:adenylate cyclase
MNTGIRLNPFHPDSYLADLAEAYFVARRYDDMIGIAERIADPSPRFAAWKAAAYAFAGREAEARREADKFLTNVRAIWAGDAGAGPAEFVAWLLSFSPFRRQEDVEHFVSGLRRAGLEGKAPRGPNGFDNSGASGPVLTIESQKNCHGPA